MKKTIVALMLASAMVMTACSGGKADSRQSAPESSAEVVSKEESPAADSKEEVVAENSETDDSQTDDEYSVGEFTETGYRSTYMGYEFTTPENCYLLTEEGLAEMAGMSFDIIEDDLGKMVADYSRNAVVYDMYASYVDNSANVNIALTPNLTTITDINAVADANLKMLENMQTMQIKVSDERETVQIAGKDYLKIKVRTTVGDVSLNQELYMALYKDKMVGITITYQDGYEDERDAFLAAFTELQ